MTPELLAWLQELDKQGGEAPPDFDYFRSLGEVVHHQGYVELKLGKKLFLDHSLQDSTHFSQLTYPGPENPVGKTKNWLCIGFSKFGRLVTARTAEEQGWDALPAVYKYLEDAKYVVVAPNVLAEEFSGEPDHSPSYEQTWFYRFFHY
jgi:hypothetical protein